MKITTIAVKQTIQIKQFHPLVIEVTAELLDTDNPEECALALRRQVDKWINTQLQQPTETEDFIPY